MASESDRVELPELIFPAGMPGFPKSRRFALSRWGGEDSPYARLVSLEDPEVVFLVAPPEAFFDDYDVQVPDEDARALQLDDNTDALVLVIVSVGEKAEEATANLLGPLVVNTRMRTAKQVVLMDPISNIRVPLRQA